MKHLYIIGNGFDIHHNINSTYRDFRDWLEEKYPRVLEDIEDVYGYCDTDWWADFENNLASLDAVEFSSNIASENQPDLLSEHCDRTWDDAQIEVESQLKAIYAEMREHFHEWITQLNKPHDDKRIKIEQDDSMFFTFNYTKTLEDMYNIPAANIKHIHGCVNDNEDFILGHGKSYDDIAKINSRSEIPTPSDNLTDEEIEQLYEEQADMAEQYHEQQAKEAAIAGIASQQKPVQSIIGKNKAFFDSLKGVHDIHIYGFSFSKIDMPYLEAIINVVGTEKTNWEISDYEGEKRIQIEEFISDHKIKDFNVIELSELLLTQ